MEDCKISIAGFKKEYPYLNLKLKKENPALFDMGIIVIKMAEFQHGFKVKKQYKTYSKGTAFNFEVFKDEKDFEKYSEQIQKIIKEYDEKYGFEYHIKKFAKEFGDIKNE